MTKTFVGWDTETCKLSKVILIANSNKEYLYKPEPYDILEFMFQYPQSKYINYFYNIDFDAKAIIKTLLYSVPQKDRNQQLQNFLKYKYFMFEDFYISYMNKKLMNISNKGTLQDVCFYDNQQRKFIKLKRLVGKRVACYLDIWQFYKMSLKKASDKYLKVGKGSFDVIDLCTNDIDKDENKLTNMIQYCIRDCINAKQLSDRVRKQFTHFIQIDKLISPAYVPQKFVMKYLKDNNLEDKYINKFIFKHLDKIRATYYGGRFETFQKGFFKKLYSYDINSAYPKTISQLKQLDGRCWKDKIINDLSESYDIIKIKIQPYKKYLNPLPFKLSERKTNPTCENCYWNSVKINTDYYQCEICKKMVIVKDKLVYYPYLKNELFKWVTQYDIKLMDEMKLKYDVEEVIHFGHNDKPIFNFVNDIYYERLQLKKNNDSLEKIYKIILNSIYGKTLEVKKGYRIVTKEVWDELPFQEQDLNSYEGKLIFLQKIVKDYGKIFNMLFGSLITAETRYRIVTDIIKQNKLSSLVQIATDGIYLTEPMDLTLSEKLGDWKKEIIHNAVFFGNGLYIHDGEFKNRGFLVKEESEFRKIIETQKQVKKRVIPLTWIKKMGFNDLHTFQDIEREFSITDHKRIFPSGILPVELYYRTVGSRAKYIE